MNKNIFKLALVTSAALAIAACSSTHPGASAAAKPANGPEAGTPGAYTQGLGQQGGFAGSSGISYKLRAPYNQIYHFAFDKDAVSQDDAKSINVQANYLVTHKGARVRLEGNTDSRGSREYNIGLGWRRARAVANLLKQQGVSSKQIVKMSYGEEKPIAAGHTEHDYALNRRVALKYEAK